MASVIEIGGRKVGTGFPPFVVAEMSANHNGNIETALNTITQAKACGADAIKLQSYTANTMTIECDRPDFQINSGLWKGQTLFDLYQVAHTPFEWHKPIFEHAKKVGITCFSTPFDESAVDLLEDLNACAYKIASFELTDIPLIKYVASTGKPIVVSTGMASFSEIEEAMSIINECNNKNVILLHCISSYPAPIETMNIRMLLKLEKDFGVLVGLSDHSLGTIAAVSATSLGACFIEKHFILDRNIGGPDSSFSIEPNELRKLCKEVKLAWESLGGMDYQIGEVERDNLRYRRSLYAVDRIEMGEKIKSTQVRRIRPGFGLEPKYLGKVLSMVASRDIEIGEAIKWDMLK
jgi:N-acetylneuraminate synthase